MDDALRSAGDALRSAKRVAVLTGAGVSAESGVPTFRATPGSTSYGLWEGSRIEDVATPEGFRRDPAQVWRFYNARRANLQSVSPNPGHFALKALQDHFGEALTLATQNVDGLHVAAGSRDVLELHGNIRRTRCGQCGEIRDRGLEPLDELPKCPACGGLLRPDIVWFHEFLPPAILARAERAARECDLFLVVGTSAVVYPAAGLVNEAKDRRAGSPAKVLEFNLAPSAVSELVDLGVYGPSGVTLPQVLQVMGIGSS